MLASGTRDLWCPALHRRNPCSPSIVLHSTWLLSLPPNHHVSGLFDIYCSLSLVCKFILCKNTERVFAVLIHSEFSRNVRISQWGVYYTWMQSFFQSFSPLLAVSPMAGLCQACDLQSRPVYVSACHAPPPPESRFTRLAAPSCLFDGCDRKFMLKCFFIINGLPFFLVDCDWNIYWFFFLKWCVSVAFVA